VIDSRHGDDREEYPSIGLKERVGRKG